jgi:hypothetical protein
MYGQLCKRLAENAPNFDPPDKPCTFRRLLLNKCRDEFENRAELCSQMEKKAAASVAASSCSDRIGEDELRIARFSAKRKMLGNIKFIGELGKLQVVHDSILHRCCEQLLVGRKRQPISDQAEDLECLCHLMKTCGRILDTPKAKVRMDQYFERLISTAENFQMPRRIRFMIQDMLEMRRNRWMPRKIGMGFEGPRTIQQVREDAYREGGIYLPQQSPPSNKGGHHMMGGHGHGGHGGHGGGLINPLERSFFDGMKSGRKGNDDLFAAGAGGYHSSHSYMGSGPGTIPAYDNGPVTSAAAANSSPPPPKQAVNGFNKNNKNDESRRGSNDGRDSMSPMSGGGGRNQQHDRRVSPVQFGGDMNKDDVRGDYNRGGGGGGGGGGYRDNHHAPALDFGDRYSQNRTKDRERRERFGPPAGGPEGQGSQDRRFNDGGRRDFQGGAGGGFNDRFNGGGGDRAFANGGAFNNAGPNMTNDNNRLPPRFKKMVLNNQQNSNRDGEQMHHQFPGGPAIMQGPGGPGPSMKEKDNMEVSLRPQAANSMLFKPKTPSMLPKSAMSNTPDGSSPLGENSLLGPALPTQPNKVMMMQQEPAIILKQASLDKGRNKDKNKQKGPTREEVFARMEKILDDLVETQSTNEAVEAWKEDNWLPSKMNQTAVTHFYKTLLSKQAESERELAIQFVSQLVGDGSINNMHCLEAVNKVLGHFGEMEKTSPAVRSHLAGAAAWSIVEGKVMTLKELDETLTQQQTCCYPVLVETLQQMLKLLDGKQEALKDMFDAVPNLKLADHVPESFRTDENLVALLEKAGLSFLMPLLAVRQEMVKHVSSPDNLSKWIAENVSRDFHVKPGFISGLFQVVMGHITEATNSAAADSNDKAAAEAEKALLEKFKAALQPFVRDSPELQLTAVYALQVFCHEKGFPKGLLLRNFVNFYEFDILDERAFLQWKEDVNDAFPGKGKALFQVKTGFIRLKYLF